MEQIPDKARALFERLVEEVQQGNQRDKTTFLGRIDALEKANRENQKHFNAELKKADHKHEEHKIAITDSIAKLVNENERIMKQNEILVRKVQRLESRKFTVSLEPDHHSGVNRLPDDGANELPIQGRLSTQELEPMPEASTRPIPPLHSALRASGTASLYGQRSTTDAQAKRKREDSNYCDAADKINNSDLAGSTQMPTRPEKQRKNEATVNQQNETSCTAAADAGKTVGSATRAPVNEDGDGENINVTPREPSTAPIITKNTVNTEHVTNGERILNFLSDVSTRTNKSSHESAGPSPIPKANSGVSALSQPSNAISDAAQHEMPNGSPRYNTKRVTKALQDALQEILMNLKEPRRASAFLKPVDYVALNIPRYPEFIKSPMDLNTMQTKLQGGMYSSVQAFVDDFDLIVRNARLFNGETHHVTQAALAMEAHFNRLMRRTSSADKVRLAKPQNVAQSPFVSWDSLGDTFLED